MNAAIITPPTETEMVWFTSVFVPWVAATA